MSLPKEYKQQLDDALGVLDTETRARTATKLEPLFGSILPDLEHAILGNPIEHHPIVLRHMLQIAASVKSPYLPVDVAAALALLHDIAAVPKITKQMVDDAKKDDPENAAILELERQENRVLHMRLGGAMAQRHLLALNKSQGRIVFDSRAIDNICEVIRVHDNPSLDIPINRSNWLAVAFREADRLWMVTHKGILADLARKDDNVRKADEDTFAGQFRAVYATLIERNERGIDEQDRDKYEKQLQDNIKRFFEERELYRPFEPTEGPFCDDVTFFRTAKGHTIYRDLCGAAYDRLNTRADNRLVGGQA